MFSEKDKILRAIVDEATPAILKMYKSKDKHNNPELDRIAATVLKKSYLGLISNKETERAEILLKFIQSKPKIAIFENFGEYWIMIANRRFHDYEIFRDAVARKKKVESIFLDPTISDEERKKICEYFGVEYFEKVFG